MTDPFRKISTFQREPSVFEEDGFVPDNVPAEDPPDFVRVPCKTCPQMCVRSDVDGSWVHVEEVQSMLDTLHRGLPYHAADPDIIDVEVLDE
jgi:hypothetical protein